MSITLDVGLWGVFLAAGLLFHCLNCLNMLAAEWIVA